MINEEKKLSKKAKQKVDNIKVFTEILKYLDKKKQKNK